MSMTITSLLYKGPLPKKEGSVSNSSSRAATVLPVPARRILAPA